MPDPVDIDELAGEVADANFGDARLTQRLRLLVKALATDPSVSLPRSLDGADLEAAYRFFSNQRVTPDDILSAHVEATRSRCADATEFLVLHDSTKFSYRSDGQRAGLGRAQLKNSRSKQMFFAHASLAVAADATRRPLGVVALKTSIRGEERSGVEHLRWAEQALVAADRLGCREKAIHVMDCEADDYEMFAALVEGNHRFTVRNQYNRLLDGEPKAKLHEALASLPAQVERQANLSRRKPLQDKVRREIHPEREARTANLKISAATFGLKRPHHLRNMPLPDSVAVNVVRVWEPEPPAGEAPIEWILYTTDPAETQEQLLTIVDRYRARWMIEEYFKAIKTGCNFEKRQLQDYESLVNLLATFAPIAYHLLLIRSEARRAPDAAALTVISLDHLNVLRIKGRRELSDSPTVREVYSRSPHSEATSSTPPTQVGSPSRVALRNSTRSPKYAQEISLSEGSLGRWIM